MWVVLLFFVTASATFYDDDNFAYLNGIVGESIDLPCNVDTSATVDEYFITVDKNVSNEWKRMFLLSDNVQTPLHEFANPDRANFLESNSSGFLRISSLQDEDKGTYRCDVTYLNGKLPSHTYSTIETYDLNNVSDGEWCLRQLDYCRPFYKIDILDEVINPVQFPENEVNFTNLCRKAFNRLKCEINVKEMCRVSYFASSYPFDYVEGDLKGVRSICAADSSLKAKVIQNLPCLKATYDYDWKRKCVGLGYQLMSQNFDAYLNVLNYYQQNCMIQTIEISCYIRKVQKNCGEEAANIVLGILTSIKRTNSVCFKADLTTEMEFIDLFELGKEYADMVKLYLENLQ